jgi:3-deoxy-manno-octulosonate cytidylyltransferase (CMP-KDO synthetase)
LYKEINSVHEFEDPNEVKVIMDKSNYAMYFTREPIPSRKKGVLNVPMFKQICSIPFRRDFLLEFSKMKRTPLEIVEGIDMNRILENSQKVKMVYSEDESYSVDSPADISRVIEFLSNDELTKKYI